MRTHDGFNDLDDEPFGFPAYAFRKQQAPSDMKWLADNIEIAVEAYELGEQAFKDVEAFCKADPAMRAYWESFMAQFAKGEEIPPHRLKAFGAWLVNKHKGALRKKKHMRLVVDNVPKPGLSPEPDPSDGGQRTERKRPRKRLAG